MAVFQGGHFYVWGDNEVGQLGNRKRSFMESPFPKRKFAVFHNVENIVAGVDSCGVIVETLPPRKKNPDRKRKQVFSQDEVGQMSEQEIKMQNDLLVLQQKHKERLE